MAIVDRKWSALPVPYAMEFPDRARKERYFDPDFYQMEAELLWPRVWQMACRLEEIPEPGDFVEYEILDQSVVVLRTDDMGVRAFQNACRHRGVRLVEGRGTCESGFTCPFHGWCYGPDGANTFVPQGEDVRRAQPAARRPRPHARALRGVGRVRVDQPRRRAPPLRECIEPFATMLDAWKVESLRTEWWYACRLPVNWKLAQEAFMEQYHVVETHPQLVIPGRYPPRDGAGRRASTLIDAELHYLRTMSEGMAGMVHANDVRSRREPARHRAARRPDARDVRLGTARSTTRSCEWHRARGSDIPDLNELEEQGLNEPMGYCFPHYFVLPMYSSASSYRFRPLGPEETLMEIWSLTRFPEGERAGEAHAARAVGVRRPALAADPRPGLLQPAQAAAGPARQGLRVHAPVRAGRGPHLELRADRRRLPRRPSLRAAAPGAAGDQREPARATGRRHRPVTSGTAPSPERTHERRDHRVRRHRLLPRATSSSPTRIPYFDWLRAQCPVHREAQHGVYMVTGYDEACAVYADTDIVLVVQLGDGAVPRVPGPARGRRRERS